MARSELQNMLLNRFLRYLAVESQSNGESADVPSSQGQWNMANLLAEELEELGLKNISINDHAVVQAYLPASSEEKEKNIDKIGWVCHMDTVDVGLNPEIRPLVIENYRGQDFKKDGEKTSYLSVKDYPDLKNYIGRDLVITDGSSVLGADNKSAIANIMTALEIIVKENRPHGDIFIAFVPDEEIGLRGARKINFENFPVDYAYTIDCCKLGELVYETFNAGSAMLYIKGRSAHPMSAKNILINPIMIAKDFMNLLDPARTPEHTEGREGYIWLTDMEANALEAKITMNIRDHDRDKYEAKKAYLNLAVDLLKNKYPEAGIRIEIEDTYSNIKDAVNDQNKPAIDLVYRAFQELDIEVNSIAMRGGTDGSYLSSKGILTPNYFTGAHNFHSRAEFLPMDDFEKSLLVTLKIIELSVKNAERRGNE